MDINFLSFVLGISVVLVAGGLTVGVIGFFKTIGLKKKIDENHKQVYVDFDKQNQNIWTAMERDRTQEASNIQSLSQGVYQDISSIKKDMDSRCDKLDNKIRNLNTGSNP